MAFFVRKKTGGRTIKSTLIVLITGLFLVLGCSSKKYSSGYLYGEKLYDSYIDLYLKGNRELAELNFYKSVSVFAERDDMCNISRLYISRYLLAEDYGEKTYLIKAEKYAVLKNCETEKNLINFLFHSDYNVDILNDLYVAYSHFLKTGEVSDLEKALANKKLNDSAKSRFYRILANNYIKSDIKRAGEYIDLAYEIDTFNGWTLNILRDLKLKLKICENTKYKCESIKKRILFIKNKLNKK